MDGDNAGVIGELVIENFCNPFKAVEKLVIDGSSMFLKPVSRTP
jgi:hypothetical protein